MRPPRRVIGYARVSSAEQALGTSLQDQQNVIHAHAQARGLKVEIMYVEAESAVHEKIERREQIRALMADVRAGDLVLVDKLDRWSRDPEYTFSSLRLLKEAGASFFAVGDNCDPSTPEGDTMLGFRVLFAREEHKRIKLRLVGTRKLLKDRGYYADGLAPFGYMRQDVKGANRNVLLVDPERSAVVRRMFQMCIEGRSLAATAERLGVHRDFVHHAIHNRVYIGESRDAHGQWIRGKHEPIIDARMFAEAHAAMALRHHAGSRPKGSGAETADWWLRDLARCGLCSAKMGAAYAGPHDARRHYYKCTHRCTSRYVRVDAIEAQADTLVLARLFELKDALASVEDDKPKEPATNDTAALEERRAKIDRKRARYVEAFSDGAMSRDELRAAMSKLDTERTKIDALLVRVPAVTSTQRREALRNMETLRRAWRRATPAQKRDALSALARSVGLTAGESPRFDWFTGEEIARWEDGKG
jgi:site-specific DNA recombinase